MHHISPLAFFPLFFYLVLVLILGAGLVEAHCPLCTVGAAAAAGGAAWLGVSSLVIGLFIGAFAVSMGWWIGRLIKRRILPLQFPLLVAASFALTIVPMLAMFPAFFPWQVSIAGGYGTPLNRLYLVNQFLLGSLIGGAIVCLTPAISAWITRLRGGRHMPFQGVALTLSLLILLGVVLQFAVGS